MKYITYKGFLDGLPHFVIFDRAVNHREMAKSLIASEYFGAGFIAIRDGRLICHGRSESMNLDSRPDKDSSLMATLNRIAG